MPAGVVTSQPFFTARAQNAELWDVEGRRYIDFGGGIGVQNTGHCHPRVVAAAQAQLARAMHTAFQVSAYEPYIELAEKLNALAPGDEDWQCLFMTTGVEAVENAIKIARYATRRHGVIAFSGAFHGRTLLGMSLTGKVVPYKAGFGPFPSEIYHVPFPRAFHGVTVDESIAAIEALFKCDIEPERVAAIIIEPVQGEGGFYIAPKELLERLRALCDKHGILLIADEIQSGYGRTGKMFAMEHSGVVPDFITVAKSLGGGLPLSGVLGKKRWMSMVAPGGLGGTYAGNPVACAAALAVLEVIDDEDLLARATQLGARIQTRLANFARRVDVGCIGEVRGLGAMVAVEFAKAGDSHQPETELTKRVQRAALARGLVVLLCGLYSNVVRILVPLTASDAIVDEGLAILEQAILEAQLTPAAPGKAPSA